MRVLICRCAVDYDGRLEAHLPEADRLVLVKADGSVSIHADDRAYKPLNWMTPPCTLRETTGDDLTEADRELGVRQLWTVENPKKERLTIRIFEVYQDVSRELGEDPGLVKDGVEAHLQELLAAQIEILGEGYTLVRREYPTAIGPVDILSRDSEGGSVAVEIKRRGGIDGVEQLTRYVELLNRDELLAPVQGGVRRPGDQAAGPDPGRGPRVPLRGAGLPGDARAGTDRTPAVLSGGHSDAAPQPPRHPGSPRAADPAVGGIDVLGDPPGDRSGMGDGGDLPGPPHGCVRGPQVLRVPGLQPEHPARGGPHRRLAGHPPRRRGPEALAHRVLGPSLEWGP
jgi:RecB family endonuclease NucS